MSYVPLGGWLGNQARGGRSVLRLESVCIQPIIWGAHGTRRLSGASEECSNSLPRTACGILLQVPPQGIVESAVVQASHLILAAQLTIYCKNSYRGRRSHNLVERADNRLVAVFNHCAVTCSDMTITHSHL